MNRRPEFPTPAHAEIADVVAGYAERLGGVDTVLVVNSCARGGAVPGSDLDMALLTTEPGDIDALEAAFRDFAGVHASVQAFFTGGPFRRLHVDFFDGVFEPPLWDDGDGPDDFEIEIGNRIAWSVPLEHPGPKYSALRERWLPFYPEPLAGQREPMVREAFEYDLDHVPFFARRGLMLQAFDRLYTAFREFLQALFIRHRCYPVAYDKWLSEQLGWIDQEALFNELLGVLSVDLGSVEALTEHSARLRSIAESSLRR